MRTLLKRIIVALVLSLISVFTAEARRVVINSLEDFQSVKPVPGLKYVIKDTINLSGAFIQLSKNSRLIFKNGKLLNGIIEGNNSKVVSKESNIFGNCQIKGSWNVDCAYSRMFDSDLETIQLLNNLSVLSSHVKLSANREYHITAKGEIIYLEILESDGKEKPTLQFHTINPNINGLDLCGNTVILRNLKIIDDYAPQNDKLYGKNNLTSGNTIGICSPNKEVQSLLIADCDFFGSTSSSYVASSQTKNCLVVRCSFSGYLADHAVYCSMKAVSFTVKDCIVNDITRTSGLFKIRTTKELESYTLQGIKAHNLNGYMAFVSLQETPKAKLLFDNITVTKDSTNSSVFYGFCLMDETNALEGTNRYNADEIIVKDCKFGYGYNGESMIYPGSGKKACVNSIKYSRVQARESNFGGGISNFLYVSNCTFDECADHQGIILGSRKIYLENTKLTRDIRHKGNNLFLINYTKVNTDTLVMKSVVFDLSVGNLFKVNDGGHLNVDINKCDFPVISRNMFYTKQDIDIDYSIKNSKNKIDASYTERSIFN